MVRIGQARAQALDKARAARFVAPGHGDRTQHRQCRRHRYRQLSQARGRRNGSIPDPAIGQHRYQPVEEIGLVNEQAAHADRRQPEHPASIDQPQAQGEQQQVELIQAGEVVAEVHECPRRGDPCQRQQPERIPAHAFPQHVENAGHEGGQCCDHRPAENQNCSAARGIRYGLKKRAHEGTPDKAVVEIVDLEMQGIEAAEANRRRRQQKLHAKTDASQGEHGGEHHHPGQVRRGRGRPGLWPRVLVQAAPPRLVGWAVASRAISRTATVRWA